MALGNTLATSTLLVLFIVRFATTMVSYGSGAPGGIFCADARLGDVVRHVVRAISRHAWFPDLIVHPQIFAVAGMGAVFSHGPSPLTGIALTIEMTGNYSLILPLIVTCMVAAIVAQALHGQPIYSVLLKRSLARAAAAES